MNCWESADLLLELGDVVGDLSGHIGDHSDGSKLMFNHVAVITDVEHRHGELVGPDEGLLAPVAAPRVRQPAGVLELELLRHAS